MRAIRDSVVLATAVLAVCLAACTRTPDTAPSPAAAAEAVDPRLPSITVSGDETGAAAWNWQAPQPDLTGQDLAAAKRAAASALAQNRLYAEAGDAIPMYMALRTLAPQDNQVAQGLKKSLQALLKQGAAALRDAGDDADALSLAG